MSTDDDLNSWGEQPATPADEILADDIDRRSGLSALIPDNAEIRADADDGELRKRRRKHDRIMQLLIQCARTIHDHSDLSGISTVPRPFPGEFEFTRLIGRGAFGYVWLAQDLKLNRAVAVKTLHLNDPGHTLPGSFATLNREAQVISSIEHPNIVRIFAWRDHGDDAYMFMQYVAGGSLDHRIKTEGPLAWHVAARYIADVAEGLMQVHERGVVHRDIKPANILWDSDRDEVLLSDFGIANRVTGPGVIAGTPAYMAPEAYHGQTSAASDVYGLGATLLHLTTGSAPFPAGTPAAMVLQDAPQLPGSLFQQSGIPRQMETIIRATLSADPDQRPPLNQFVQDLRGTLNRLLADTLLDDMPETAAGDVGKLRISVSRLEQDGSFREVAATHQEPEPAVEFRNMTKKPRRPDSVHVTTGDEIKIQVAASVSGYLTVFNIGPGGALNLLFPETMDAAGAAVEDSFVSASQAIEIDSIVMTPPAGNERLFAVLAADSQLLDRDTLLALAADTPGNVSKPYLSTRNMVRVKKAASSSAGKQSNVSVLEIVHAAGR